MGKCHAHHRQMCMGLAGPTKDQRRRHAHLIRFGMSAIWRRIGTDTV